ncbi:telomere repeat binding factor-domain-containing protein [Scheffersomyces coipomensis]|uniref:telomere repeat binding factor-domain-containing protein n=1 Tax=Scheffersomyces coipomensis TaxID=1788519 RepID=UPI00315D42F8
MSSESNPEEERTNELVNQLETGESSNISETADKTTEDNNDIEVIQIISNNTESNSDTVTSVKEEQIDPSLTESSKRSIEDEGDEANKRARTEESTNITTEGVNKEGDSTETSKTNEESNTAKENGDAIQENPADDSASTEANKSQDQSIQINEKEDLAMIANELENATESNKDKEADKESEEVKSSEETVLHDGIQVPANSELLNTSTALAAYKALSSQLPPLAILANAQMAALPLPIVAADYLPPRIQLLVNTLPTLDNLATQLLRVIALGPYQKIIDLASNPETPAGATFRDLTSLFEFTKRLYSEEDPFLTVEHLAPGMWKEGDKTPSMFRNREQSIESTLRKVNLATFLSATLGTIEIGFFYLNESFLDVFCPANNLEPNNALSNMGSNSMSLQSGINTAIGEKVGKLLKPQAELYLDLKTQAYISAIDARERSREEILEDILPSNLDVILLSRRAIKVLSPIEADFIERCRSRKDILLSYDTDRNLSEEYDWFTFLKVLFDYVAKNMGFLIWGKKGRPTKGRSLNDGETTPHSQELLSGSTTEPIGNTTPSDENVLISRPSTTTNVDINANSEMKSKDINDIMNALLPSEIAEQQIHLRINPNPSNKTQARRPWTREEEKALRHALELKGPQWSTILELFGNGGKISEALKNRSQVQLKDKARNWKMFFLKSGLPVPAYLQRVTGELERDDKLKGNKRGNKNKKTAAAPVPSVQQHQSSQSQPPSQSPPVPPTIAQSTSP